MKKVSETTTGRPCLPEGTARTERVVALLTKSERAELLAQAKLRSLSLSGYSHRLIIEGLRKNQEPTG
ncbi:MAG: hypothetical protein FalmKO_07470 [Falsiruegeria mediterranea]